MVCGYYFKMSQLITNLKCHICYNPPAELENVTGGEVCKNLSLRKYEKV